VPGAAIASGTRMIDAVVQYLHEAGIPFRLTSYPAPEPMPPVAHRLLPGARLVETRVVLVDGRPALACTVSGENVSLTALATQTGGVVVDSGAEDLSGDYRGATGPIPPLGHLMGVPLFVDIRVTELANVAFRAFGPNDYLELSYEDLALVEHPRVASFGEAGELPPHA
jgi:prolyl-tRNA editing enzyme YbaK/EbsC (Cys-tRNA(Pro) deacylase)